MDLQEANLGCVSRPADQRNRDDDGSQNPRQAADHDIPLPPMDVAHAALAPAQPHGRGKEHLVDAGSGTSAGDGLFFEDTWPMRDAVDLHAARCGLERELPAGVHVELCVDMREMRLHRATRDA